MFSPHLLLLFTSTSAIFLQFRQNDCNFFNSICNCEVKYSCNRKYFKQKEKKTVTLVVISGEPSLKVYEVSDSKWGYARRDAQNNSVRRRRISTHPMDALRFRRIGLFDYVFHRRHFVNLVRINLIKTNKNGKN